MRSSKKVYNPCDYLFHIQMSYQALLSWKLDAEVRRSHPCTGPWFAMQIASIPQKALSPLLSRRGRSNRYPVRPAKKIRGGGKSGPCRKCRNNTGITTRLFRIMKRGARFGRKMSSCPHVSRVCLRKDTADECEPGVPFCWLAAANDLKGAWKGPSPRKGGQRGVVGYQCQNLDQPWRGQRAPTTGM